MTQIQRDRNRAEELRRRVEEFRRDTRAKALQRRERVEELNKRGELAQRLLRRVAEG